MNGAEPRRGGVTPHSLPGGPSGSEHPNAPNSAGENKTNTNFWPAGRGVLGVTSPRAAPRGDHGGGLGRGMPGLPPSDAAAGDLDCHGAARAGEYPPAFISAGNGAKRGNDELEGQHGASARCSKRFRAAEGAVGRTRGFAAQAELARENYRNDAARRALLQNLVSQGPVDGEAQRAHPCGDRGETAGDSTHAAIVDVCGESDITFDENIGDMCSAAATSGTAPVASECGHDDVLGNDQHPGRRQSCHRARRRLRGKQRPLPYFPLEFEPSSSAAAAPAGIRISAAAMHVAESPSGRPPDAR